MRILHISDFHVCLDEECKWALREGFYKEYLSGLVDVIHKVEKIFITGDLVDRGDTTCYDLVLEIISYLSDEFSISENDIFIVNGNHDACRDNGLIEFYKRFNKYGGKWVESKCKLYRYSLIKPQSAVLCFNSLHGNNGNGLPVGLESKVVDEIVDTVNKLNLDNLYVLSHHPPVTYELQADAPFDETSDWAARHVWPDGGHIYHRLSNRSLKLKNIIWFSGDVHRQEFSCIEDLKYISVTGSLNGYQDSTTPILPQARLIDTNNMNVCNILEYAFSGHNKKGLHGKWRIREDEVYQVPGRKKKIVSSKYLENTESVNDALIHHPDVAENKNKIRYKLISEK